MPWFPDFANAVELARIDTRAAGLADPVAQYVKALNEGTSRALEAAWPGEVVIYDPRAGEVRGHRQLRRFVNRNKSWLAQHGARVETVASTRVPGRAVVELLAHLNEDAPGVAWPVAVVAESSEDDLSVVFRTYCSQQPVDGRRHLRPPILEPGPRSSWATSSTAITPRWTKATPTRSWTPSRPTVTTASRSARTPIAAPNNCARSSPTASAQVAASR